MKSGNVLVARDENEKILAVKLCDFGVAKICENKLSSANTVVGTPGLMAPEIRFGSSLYTEKVDSLFPSPFFFFSLLNIDQNYHITIS